MLSTGFVTTKQAAEYLGISTSTLYSWTKSGRLEGVAFRFDKAWRYKLDKLTDWTNEGEYKCQPTNVVKLGTLPTKSTELSTEKQLRQLLNAKRSASRKSCDMLK